MTNFTVARLDKNVDSEYDFKITVWIPIITKDDDEKLRKLDDIVTEILDYECRIPYRAFFNKNDEFHDLDTIIDKLDFVWKQRDNIRFLFDDYGQLFTFGFIDRDFTKVGSQKLYYIEVNCKYVED